jgi:hypothetical protein
MATMHHWIMAEVTRNLRVMRKLQDYSVTPYITKFLILFVSLLIKYETLWLIKS